MNKKVINVKRKSLKDVQKVWRIIIQDHFTKITRKSGSFTEKYQEWVKAFARYYACLLQHIWRKKKNIKNNESKAMFLFSTMQSFLLKLSPTMYTCMQSFGVGIIAV